MERWWLKVPKRICTMALNVEMNDGLECQKLRKMVTSNAWMDMRKGSERQTKEKKGWHWMTNWPMALNTKNDNTTLNTKTKKDSESKCTNRYEKRLWTPKLKGKSESKGLKKYANGSECQLEDIDSKHQTEGVALNAKLEKIKVVNARLETRLRTSEERQVVALNVETKMWLWTPNRRCR